MKALKIAVILLLGSSVPLLAIPKDYVVAGGSVAINTIDPGLVLDYSLASGLTGTSFTLNDGLSSSFGFFNIWTTESAINNDDKSWKPISATLSFSTPISSATIDGDTYGVKAGFLGSYQAGKVVWDGPATMILSDRTFQISLSNETFNAGYLWSLGCKGATVEATVTQITSVPDGGITLMLLGLGLSGLAFGRRFMKA